MLTGWSYYKTITVESGLAGGNLSNVVLLVQIDADADIGAHALSTGNDIRFALTDDTLLTHYRIYHSTSGGNATGLWKVKLPSYNNASGNTIRIWYGNAGAGYAGNAASTQESSANAVYDFRSGGSLSYSDAIGIYDGTGTDCSLGVGPAGLGACAFNGSSSCIDVLSAPPLSSCTLVASMNITGPGSGNPFAFNGYDGEDGSWGLGAVSPWSFSLKTENTSWGDLTGPESDTGNWHQLIGTYDPGTGTATLYVDGVQEESSIENWTGNLASVSAMKIGSNAWNEFMYGLVANIEIHGGAKSPEWCTFKYHTVHDSDHGLSFGAEVQAAASRARVVGFGVL